MNSKFFVVLTMVLCLAGMALAQSSTGSIQGTVTDTQGAVIPDASVVITNQATGRVITVKTSGDGLFSQPALDPGSYKVEVDQPNFQKSIKDVVLQTAQVVNLDFALAIGGTSQTVEVSAATPIVDTATSGISDVVTGSQITDLPLNGRNLHNWLH